MAQTLGEKLAKALIEQEKGLRTDRQPLEALWQNIARYVLPRAATFTEEVAPNVERNRHVLDSTAPRSLEMFGSFLHNLLNNPATQWLVMRALNEKLKDSQQAKRWMQENSEIMLAALAAKSANIYFHLHEAYIDIGAFGTAVLFIEMVKDELRVRSHHLMDCVLAEGENGQIDTVHRTFRLTPRQARQRWPKGDLGKSVEDGTSKKSQTPIEFMHCTFPLTDATRKLLPARVRNSNAPFASVWLNKKDGVMISAGTYQEFPYLCPRWYKVRGEIYGRSPAMTALPDIRMVNRMTETVLRGAEKIVDPPLLLPDGGLVSPIRLFPGGLSFSDGVVQPQPLIPPGASRIEVGNQLLEQRQNAIRESFFTPLFQTPDNQYMTATQVLQIADDRNRMVSPMLVRMQSELHARLADRVFGLLSRAGKLTPLPDVLVDEEIGVEYVSPLTAAQLQGEGLALMRLFEQVAPWAEVDPGVFDRYDLDKASLLLGDATGVPASVVRSDIEMQRHRQQRQNREAQLAQAAALPDYIKAGASATSAQAALTKAEKA